jgi:diguanylate cyclase (GGDEF)-like protein/putative nucleotidyltransferase with HDIG domain
MFTRSAQVPGATRLGAGAMTTLRQRVDTLLALDPEESVLAGRVSGALYGMGGLTVWSFLILPGVSHTHPGWIIGISAGALLWGLSSLFLIDWSVIGPWLIQASSLAAFVLIGAAMASSGGAQSPGWVYLFFIVVFASYFYRPEVAGLYLAGCIATLALPFIYDARWDQSAFLSRVVVGGPSFLVLSITIVTGREMMRRLRARAELLASEQSALRRVATAVIQGQAPETIFELVAREAAGLLRAGGAGILRFDSESHATVVGSWSDRQGGRYESGTRIDIDPAGDVARARRTGLAVRIQSDPGDGLGQLGYSASVIAPVQVAGRLWGAVAVGAGGERPLTARDEQQLMLFGDLLASAIASIDDRAALAAQASTDPLTGLANRRSLHERLAAEVARSQRHGRILSVALLDIDHFKQVNDFGGHEAGDEMLAQVARGLTEQTRAEDILGRFGGDEFAWVMPETTREQALVAIERARRLIALSSSRTQVTLSAGICDTRVTAHPAQLVNYADTALYWSKVHGRNRAWIYDPQVSQALTPSGPLDSAERSQAQLGLRALSRAIDAKGPSTSGHSERVAAVAAKLAHAAGWAPERGVLLREAALVHDVGKVGLPERLLIKPERLTDAERALVIEHVELAVRMVEGVLAAEQVQWIRSHHERPDGKGYPHGLTEAEIPEGAALLAVADAWEAMRTGRPYRPAKTPDAALAECARLVDTQFTRTAVGALMKLHATGDLDDEWDRLLSESSQPSG